MEQYSRGKTFRKLILGIMILVVITAAIVASYLIYKGNFNNIAYSNWLFYASMSYILLGGLSMFGSTMSTNSIGYKYASTVMSSSYEQRKKIDDMLLNNSLNFSMKMIAVGFLLLLVSAGADRFL
jgi:hypothetical protein